MRSHLHLVMPAALACATFAGAAQGYPLSQRATVTQHIAFTEISIVYGRPTARGRELFGHLVAWDNVWHPGADSATRITIDHDITMEGHAVKAGEYSIWLIPREKAAWTVILSTVAHTFHNRYPGESKDYLRFDVTAETLSYMESLAYYFPAVNKDEATLRIHWGTVGVPIRIKAAYQP